MVVRWLALSPHSKRVLGSNPPFCVESSHNPKDRQVRLIGDFKLPEGVSDCLSLYASPVTDWRPVQGVPRLLPNPRGPLRISGIDNGWMEIKTVPRERGDDMQQRAQGWI